MVGWWNLWGEESTAGTHVNSRVPLDIVVLGNTLVNDAGDVADDVAA
jgi:hypothetical protein